MKHLSFIYFLLIVLISSVNITTLVQGQGNIPGDFCITQEEYRLFQLINEYRKGHGLDIIPFSTSLSYVAKVHVRDLYINKPDTSYCNLNSWSGQGTWTACCHSSLTPQPECILGKPGELTGYEGEGHELCYWENVAAHPDTVFGFWKTVEQANDILLNMARWESYRWQAVGIGIYEGYAWGALTQKHYAVHASVLEPVIT